MPAFLTDEWFTEVDRLTQDAGDLNLPPSISSAALNLDVSDTANGNVQAHLDKGLIKKGHTDSADTTVTIDDDTLRSIALKGDMNEAMQAFMSGKIRVEGDMSQLMALQNAKPSAEQKVLFKKIYDMTDDA